MAEVKQLLALHDRLVEHDLEGVLDDWARDIRKDQAKETAGDAARIVEEWADEEPQALADRIRKELGSG